MKFSHIFFLMFLMLNFSLGAFAQNIKSEENTKSKEQLELEVKAFELLEQITNEIALLKAANCEMSKESKFIGILLSIIYAYSWLTVLARKMLNWR